MVSVDIYLNETTRHADVILPPRPACSRAATTTSRSTRSPSATSPTTRRRSSSSSRTSCPSGRRCSRLAGIVGGQGSSADAAATLDDFVLTSLVQKAVARDGSHGRGPDAGELLAALSVNGRRGPERVLDLMLRTGPYGDGFGADPDGLSLAELEANPHGVDLGPLQPRLPEVLRTPSGKIELAPEAIVADVDAPPAAVARPRHAEGEHGARRPARPAVEQLVDAQPRGAGEGQAALHAAGPSRRRRPPGARRRRRRPGRARGSGRSRSRSRSPTRSCRAS